MKAIIDRFEGTVAVLTPAGGGKPFHLSKELLPAGAAAGDTMAQDGSGKWTVDRDDTEARRARIAEKARRLFRE